jgi:hypothetical protein
MWDLWWDKEALGRFSPNTSVSSAVVRSTNYSTITLIYHPGKMYNRPMCGRSTGTYTNQGDLQRDLMGLSPTPPNKKKTITMKELCFLRGPCRDIITRGQGYSLVSSVQESVKRRLQRVKLKNLLC